MAEKKYDIWSEGVRSIMAATKRSLLDYIDALARQTTIQEKALLEKVKARVHNDVSQASFNVGVLLATLRSGGDISAFEEDFVKKDSDKIKALFSDNKNGTISS